MVDLAVPGYFSKKIKQPMKILMLLRIFLFIEFWIFKLIRVENLVLAFDLLFNMIISKLIKWSAISISVFFIGCNKLHKLLGYHFYPMRSKHGSYWLISYSWTFAHWTSLICKNKLFWGQWVLKMHLFFTRKMMAGSKNNLSIEHPLKSIFQWFFGQKVHFCKSTLGLDFLL